MNQFVRDPKLEKANSALEFGVSVAEMDELAAEWDFTVDSRKLTLSYTRITSVFPEGYS